MSKELVFREVSDSARQKYSFLLDDFSSRNRSFEDSKSWNKKIKTLHAKRGILASIAHKSNRRPAVSQMYIDPTIELLKLQKRKQHFFQSETRGREMSLGDDFIQYFKILETIDSTGNLKKLNVAFPKLKFEVQTTRNVKLHSSLFQNFKSLLEGFKDWVTCVERSSSEEMSLNDVLELVSGVWYHYVQFEHVVGEIDNQKAALFKNLNMVASSCLKTPFTKFTQMHLILRNNVTKGFDLISHLRIEEQGSWLKREKQLEHDLNQERYIKRTIEIKMEHLEESNKNHKNLYKKLNEQFQVMKKANGVMRKIMEDNEDAILMIERNELKDPRTLAEYLKLQKVHINACLNMQNVDKIDKIKNDIEMYPKKQRCRDSLCVEFQK